tara:strand:+ start:969 stop:1352 length:384 start_codon:yes stop_codon:yes gene_type:complete
MSVIRKTKTVKLVLQEFDQINEAISVIELVEKFSKKMDKTTVYRILDRLEDSGELHSFVDQDGLKRYAKSGINSKADNNIDNHPHFLCEDCGISSCLPVKIQIPEIPNYSIKSAEHFLVGQCENCIK